MEADRPPIEAASAVAPSGTTITSRLKRAWLCSGYDVEDAMHYRLLDRSWMRVKSGAVT